MSDLFQDDPPAHQNAMRQEGVRDDAPLADKLRPDNLSQVIGQDHITGKDGSIGRMVAAGKLSSIILWGPPGTGKTSIARLLAAETNMHYKPLSAVFSGVADLKKAFSEAEKIAQTGKKTLLFVDEIHRFNKAQQDAMLADVEDGVVTLIGATTSNPFFAINGALVSRSQVFQFEPLAEDEVKDLINRALNDKARGLGDRDVTILPPALDYLAKVCDGDARKALAVLETALIAAGGNDRDSVTIDKPIMKTAVGQRAVQYDPTGDEHYDCASALIKSIRGSDPDAGLYWLARMLEGGEDVRFLCRRLIILASEDVGNADPHALPLAVACSQACEQIGLPECQLTLSQTVAYLACAPKSNAATSAISAARSDVREDRILPVPRHLRDSHYREAGKLGHGTGYEYSHDEQDGISSQDYLGVEREYYQPVDRGFEAELKTRLEKIRAKLKQGKPKQGKTNPS
jgi:putative ATPase